MANQAALDHPVRIDEQSDPILAPAEGGRRQPAPLSALDWRQAVGGLLIMAGLLTVSVAWFGVSGTTSTTAQLSYMTSGGLGGVGLIIIGALFFISFEHARDRQALSHLDARLRHMEEGLAGELDVLYEAVGVGSPNGSGAPRRSAQ
ncbi:MAG TPA: hypothetical protein VGQ80_02100 [Acidimicrobiia bacterium]|nr:hypothetical protein [Acidimicrobiia bacterium]